MGGLFSKGGNHDKRKNKRKPNGTVTSKDQAVLDLKRARDRLTKFQKKTEGERDTYVAKAKALLKDGKRDRAKLALRMKRYKDKQLEKVDGELFNLVQMVNEIDWAEQNIECVRSAMLLAWPRPALTSHAAPRRTRCTG